MLLQGDGGQTPQRAVNRVDRDTNRFERREAQNRLTAFRPEEHSATGHMAEELNRREAETILLSRWTVDPVCALVDRNNPNAVELIRGGRRIWSVHGNSEDRFKPSVGRRWVAQSYGDVHR